ncbi:hypothetical protein AURDEDRAFT_111802 [Auricularia subglabra TFB-10046 SS5]|nr:hypothetical protein AURDEDRAFT_111802 [Auricularia subglabra TFB-10046 SS5]
MSSAAARLPAEVWLTIIALLPQPCEVCPRPKALSALYGTNRFLRRIMKRIFYSRLFLVNPLANSTVDLAGFVQNHVAELERDRELRHCVRELVIKSHEGDLGFKYAYPDFLSAVEPFERILHKLGGVRKIEFQRLALSSTGHAALYRLQHLQSLEFDFTYLAPLPNGLSPPKSKLKRLSQIVIHKQTSVQDQVELDTLVALVLAAPALRSLQAEEPILSTLAKRRRRLQLEHLCVTLPKDLHALLRCCPSLRSIEFAFIPISAPVPELVPKLERYRGPVHGMRSYVPGRPVHTVDITGTCDPEQLDGTIPSLLSATAPTRAVKFTLGSRGCLAYRMGKLEQLSSLSELEQLVVDSDVGCQTTESFAREFTARLAGKLTKLEALDVVGVDAPGNFPLQQYLGDPRLQSHVRERFFASPPPPADWELELAKEWAAKCPGLKGISWGPWRWDRRTCARSGEDVWVRRRRALELRLHAQ